VSFEGLRAAPMEGHGERGPGGGGVGGGGVIACGQAVVARRAGLRGGGSQRRHRKPEGRKLLTAQRKLTDGPYVAVAQAQAQGASRGQGQGQGSWCQVSGRVRCRCCATTLLATEAQGKAHQSKSREILYENSRLHMVSEGKQHLERAMDSGWGIWN
jgi:hypothetical protein